MRPGWLDCDEQHEYLKAHVQGFEDTMKDPLARRNWNAAFNQGWEEKWALGKTLRKVSPFVGSIILGLDCADRTLDHGSDSS